MLRCILLILALGFQDQFLENVIAPSNHAERFVSAMDMPKMGRVVPDLEGSAKHVPGHLHRPCYLKDMSKVWLAKTETRDIRVASGHDNKSCASYLPGASH